MTPRQILDSFSETLMRDERILSPQERSLIASLLQHARAANANAETHDAVVRVVAAAIGETIAQRAFAVLGSSIVERILQTSSAVAESGTGESLRGDLGSIRLNVPPPPSPSQPQTPSGPLRVPATPPSPTQPQPPSTTQPQPPSTTTTTIQPQTPSTKKAVSNTAVAEIARPERLAANCVILDEFLAPQELEQLTRFTLEHEGDFQTSEVLSPTAEKGVINDDFRRSRVLMDLADQQDMILAKVKSVLPRVLEKLGMDQFAITGAEAQITASNDGDFFQFHNDNGSEAVASRHFTFVYFFHREPRQFEGGELRIHDARLENGVYVSEGTYQTIVPQQNQIVFFPCELLHEITPVKCPSHRFGDSRFTLNGWLRQ